MQLKIKKLHPHAVIPSFGSEYSAGLDLTAISYEDEQYGKRKYRTGLAIEIAGSPSKKFVGKIYPRSSISKKNLMLANSVGIIDQDYRGEIIVVMKPQNYQEKVDHYESGDRIAQLVIEEIPVFTIHETDELSDTHRGTGGFGSTGR